MTVPEEVIPLSPETSTTPPAPMERLLYEVKKVIVGQDHLLERLIVALLARGHVLVEGVPGLAKTMAIKSLAQSIGGDIPISESTKASKVDRLVSRLNASAPLRLK